MGPMMEAHTWLELAKTLGPNIGIIAFFVWRDYKREYRLEERLDEVHAFIRDELMKALDRNTQALCQHQTPTYSDQLSGRSTR